MHTTVLQVRTGDRQQVVDLSGRCAGWLRDIGAADGLLNVFVPHATAGLVVLETGAGSDEDLLAALAAVLPASGPGGAGWRHVHGSPGHGRDHVLPGMVPPYATLPVLGGSIAFGTWQSICLVDTNIDNPVRSVRLSFVAG
jgi:secondary thiamine-phosphate synthase enzyme